MNKAEFKTIVSDIVNKHLSGAVLANACEHKLSTNEGLPQSMAKAIHRGLHIELSKVFDVMTTDEIETIISRIITHYSTLAPAQAPNLIAKIIKSNWAGEVLITHRLRNFCKVKGTGEEFFYY